jgi:hypothetical protein
LRAAALCYGIDVGAPPALAADGHVDAAAEAGACADGGSSRAVFLDVRRAGGGATAAPLAAATATRALQFLIARDAHTFVSLLRALHARAAAVASKAGAAAAAAMPGYDVDATTFAVEDCLERLRAGAAAGAAAGALSARCSALSEGLLELYLAAERFEDALRLLLVERSSLLARRAGAGRAAPQPAPAASAGGATRRVLSS